MFVQVRPQSFADVEAIEFAKVQLSKTLGGIVVDASGSPIPGTQVLEVSADWNTTIRSTTANAAGRWSLQPIQKRRTYYLRFRSNGFNEVRCRVRLSKFRGKESRITLPVGT